MNVYNPEKPNLEITKRVLAEKAGGKHVDLAGLTLTFKDGGTKYTRIFNKDSADETTVRIDNMAPGAYTITESGQPQNTSIQYFGVYNQNQLIIGFSRTKNGSTHSFRSGIRSRRTHMSPRCPWSCTTRRRAA